MERINDRSNYRVYVRKSYDAGQQSDVIRIDIAKVFDTI